MLDSTEQKIIDDIARIGWSCIGVPEDEHGPGFVYSIGMMQSLDHPEIIMFGLKLALMFDVVNLIGHEVRSGRRFAEAGLYEDLLNGCAAKLLPVDEAWHAEYFGYAMWHRRYLGRMATLQAMQCIWPDQKGLFPDEPGCHPAVVRLQPLPGIS